MVLNKNNLDDWGIGSASNYCVFFCPMNSATSNYDLSGDAATVSTTGTLSTIKTKDGANATKFPGSGTNMLVKAASANNEFTGDVTFAFWLKGASGQANYTTVMSCPSSANDFSIRLYGDKLGIYHSSPGHQYDMNTFDVLDDKWHFCVLRRTGTSFNVFIDNMAGATPISLTGTIAGNYYFNFGIYTTSLPFNGSLRNFMIFKGIALTTTQMRAIYDATYIE